MIFVREYLRVEGVNLCLVKGLGIIEMKIICEDYFKKFVYYRKKRKE